MDGLPAELGCEAGDVPLARLAGRPRGSRKPARPPLSMVCWLYTLDKGVVTIAGTLELVGCRSAEPYLHEPEVKQQADVCRLPPSALIVWTIGACTAF